MTEDLPRISIVGDEGVETGGEVVRRPPPPRWIWAALVVVFALVAGVVVSAGDDTDDGSEDPAASTDPTSTTSTTTTPRSTTSRRTTTTVPEPEGEFISGAPGPVLDRPVSAVVLFNSSDGWRLLDLDTGWYQEIDALGDGGAGNPVVVGGRVFVDLFARSSIGAYDVVRDADGTTVLDEVDDLRVLSGLTDPSLYPMGGVGGDRVWVVGSALAGGQEMRAIAIGRDGQRVGGPIDLPTWPSGATEAGLVVEAGGRVYLATEGGVREIGTARVTATAPRAFAWVVCDTAARCREQVVDVPGLQVSDRRGVSAIEAGVSAATTMSLSDNGHLASSSYEGVPQIVVTRANGVTSTVPVDDPSSPPAWLPGGADLLVPTYSSGVFHHRFDADGNVTSRRLADLDVTDVYQLVIVPV